MPSNNGAQGAKSMSMRQAALMQFGSKYVSIGMQLLVTAVLARLVTPAEFGTLAIVTVFTAFFTMFSDMGVGVAIVQFRDLDEEDFGRLFGFSAVLAVALGLLFCLMSVPISWFYGDSALVPLCCVASLSLVFSTLNMVPNGIMLRERKFGQIGLRLVVGTLISGAVAIAFAALGGGCYALVLQIIASYAVVLAWNLISCPIRKPSLHFMVTLRRVFSYSGFQFASSLVNYFNRNIDNLLIGKIAGAQMLGYYDKAYKLTTYPMTSFSSVIASVIQPFMAEHQDDTDVIFTCWLRIARLCSLVGAAISVAMFCCSEEIILVMYGEQWMASVPLLHALALGVFAQMIGNPTGAFFQSLGRTDLMFTCSLVNTCIMLLAIVGGLIVHDVEVLSWLVSAAFFVQLVSIGHYLVRLGFGKGPRELTAFVPSVAGAGLACAAGMAVGALLPAGLVWQFAGRLTVSFGVLAAVYGVTGQLAFLRSFLSRSTSA